MPLAQSQKNEQFKILSIEVGKRQNDLDGKTQLGPAWHR